MGSRRQLRRLLALIIMFTCSVLTLDQLGVFLKLGEEQSLDPGYDYPVRGDQFDDLLPTNHLYDSLEYRIHNNTACAIYPSIKGRDSNSQAQLHKNHSKSRGGNHMHNQYSRSFPPSNSGSPLRLALFVKSALEHHSRRNVIRRTWGRQRFSNVATRTFFVVGRGRDDSDLIIENDRHRDIIQADFIDSYYNNTLKTMASLRWATQFCRGAQYFLFIDDDYYLSVKNLLRFLNVFEVDSVSEQGLGLNGAQVDVPAGIVANTPSSPFVPVTEPRQYVQVSGEIAETGGQQPPLLFVGTLFPYSAPMRHRFSKWFVSLSDYPFSRYPPYVTAGAMLLSGESARRIYAASKFTRHFVFDDIFLGICARKARVWPRHSDFFSMYRLDGGGVGGRSLAGLGVSMVRALHRALAGHSDDAAASAIGAERAATRNGAATAAAFELRDMIAVHGYTDGDLELLWNVAYRDGYA